MCTNATSELLRSLQGRFDNAITFEEVVSRGWVSRTFVGTRHAIVMSVAGDDAGARVDRFAHRLSDCDLPMRGHILADIAVISDDRQPGTVRFGIEALTVEDAA